MRFTCQSLRAFGTFLILASILGLGSKVCWGQPAPATATPSHAAQTASQAYSLPPAKLAKAIALNRIRVWLHFGGDLSSLLVLWLLLAMGLAARLAAWAEGISKLPWLQGLLFFGGLLILLPLADLPLAVYGHWVSRSYGISVQGWGGWLLDAAKEVGLSVLIGAPIMLLFHWIVRVAPRRYWLWAWMAAVPLMVISVFASPLIEPWFNQYEPLAKSNPALVAQLEKVAARTGASIPADRMFLMKASLKTNGLNAYVSGLGATKRIVVWDTTAGRIPNDEILFIFGHESGHYVLHHLPKGLACSALILFFVFWACAKVAGWLAARFGGRWGLPGENPLAARAGFVVLLLVAATAQFLLAPAGNAISRHFEHEADIYGQEAIHGIVADPQQTAVAAFNALGEAWLDDPDPNPFVEFWSYSHPSVSHRAQFALRYDPWANGGRGRFFRE